MAVKKFPTPTVVACKSTMIRSDLSSLSYLLTYLMVTIG